MTPQVALVTNGRSSDTHPLRVHARERGAVSPRTLAYVDYCSRRARGKHARDGTKYGRSRMSTRSFYTHHTQRLSFAAAVGDVMGISKEIIRHMKQRLCGIALPSVAA